MSRHVRVEKLALRRRATISDQRRHPFPESVNRHTGSCGKSRRGEDGTEAICSAKHNGVLTEQDLAVGHNKFSGSVSLAMTHDLALQDFPRWIDRIEMDLPCDSTASAQEGHQKGSYYVIFPHDPLSRCDCHTRDRCALYS